MSRYVQKRGAPTGCGVVLVLLAALSACGDSGAADDADANDSPLAETDTGDTPTAALDCTEKRESWRLAGTISGDGLESAPGTLMVLEEHRWSCAEDPDEIWLETPGRPLLLVEIEAPGPFDVEVPVDYSIQPPDLFLRLHVDVNRDGDCDGGDQGTTLALPPGSRIGLAVVLEPGCPGLPL